MFESNLKNKFIIHQTKEDIQTNYPVNLQDIQNAALRIHEDIHHTPIMTCSSLDSMMNNSMKRKLFFKCENFQKVGAFKFRGAINAIRQLKGKYTSVVTHSSGNHAQAVALSSKCCNITSTIIMPNDAPKVKQLAVQGYGGKIVYCKPNNKARQEAADQIVKETNAYFVHPSNDVDVISGQGTVGLEILKQVMDNYGESLDAVVIPIGGGGLCAGVAIAIKSISPSTKVYGVEPIGANDAFKSFYSKTLQGHDSPPKTIADGLKTTLGCNTWPIIRDLVDEIIQVSDDEIIDAMRVIWERMKLVVEPSGAVSLAGILSKHFETIDKTSKNIGIVLSGGNVDLSKLPF